MKNEQIIVYVDPHTGEPVVDCDIPDSCQGNFYSGTLCGGCGTCMSAQAIHSGLIPHSEEYAIGWYMAKKYLKMIETVELKYLPKLFKIFEQVNGSIKIRTPFTYHDGTVIDLFLTDSLILTDYGETLRIIGDSVFYSRDNNDILLRDLEDYKQIYYKNNMLSIDLLNNKVSICEAILQLSKACIQLDTINRY